MRSEIEPTGINAELTIPGILERKIGRLNENLDSLNIPRGSMDDLISPDELQHIAVRPKFAVEVDKKDGHVFHLEISGRLINDIESSVSIPLTKDMFREVFGRVSNLLQATADVERFKLRSEMSREDPVLAMIKINKDCCLTAPILYPRSKVIKDTQSSNVEQMQEYLASVSCFLSPLPEYVKDILGDDESIPLEEYFSRVVSYYKNHPEWMTSRNHRIDFQKGLSIYESNIPKLVSELYFWYVLSHPDFGENKKDRFDKNKISEEFKSLDQDQKSSFLASMTAFVSGLNVSLSNVRTLANSKLENLPQSLVDLFLEMADFNSKENLQNDPIFKSFLFHLFRKENTEGDQMRGLDEKLFRVSYFSASIEQYDPEHGHLLKNLRLEPNDEPLIAEIVFDCLTGKNDHFSQPLFPGILQGKKNIPKTQVIVRAPFRSHMIFSNPRPEVWHASILISNPLEMGNNDILDKESIKQHMRYVEAI